MKKLLITTALILAPTAALGENCNYDRQTSLTHTKRIERTIVNAKDITRIGMELFKCSISVKSKVDGEWFDGEGEFTYSLDMTGSEGCSRALARAKEAVYNLASPEVISSKIDMQCNTEIETNNRQNSVLKQAYEAAIPMPKELPEMGEIVEITLDNDGCRMTPHKFKYQGGYIVDGFKAKC